jgi:DNA-directed RNA polymerase subunit delta
MNTIESLKITPEQAKEMPMVDLAFLILKAANTPYYYRDLMQEIAKIKGISDDEVMDVIAQLYTEINIDGRFACVGNNLWGLKRWYPVEKGDDGVANAQRPRIINDDDDDEDEELFEDADAEYDDENYDGILEDEDYVDVDAALDDEDDADLDDLPDDLDDEFPADIDEELDDSVDEDVDMDDSEFEEDETDDSEEDEDL